MDWIEHIDLGTCKGEVGFKLSEAWKLARDDIKRAQQLGEAGDQVFVYIPAAKACKEYKSFHGPYHIVEQSKTGVSVLPVDQPQAEPIQVAYNKI